MDVKGDVNISTNTVATTGSDIHKMGELMGTPSMAIHGEIAVHSGYVTAPSHADEARATRTAWLEQLQSDYGDEEFDTARSRPDWTEVAHPTSMSVGGPSTSDLELVCAENELHFQRLVADSSMPPLMSARDRSQFGTQSYSIWEALCSQDQFLNILCNSPFFTDFGGRLVVGRRIGGGGQAEIYEALFEGRQQHYVLKVFKRESSLAELQRCWAFQIGRNTEEWKACLSLLRTCCLIACGTLLPDGRFAFLMGRYWGDVRKSIDLQIVKDKSHSNPPFPLSIVIDIMGQIAMGMTALHASGILHRDLKAANDIEDLLRHGVHDYTNMLCCHVADFESSEGVMGTGFWRAPEILIALMTRTSSEPQIWTQKVDVYSYAMTCYEILTGCVPFQNRSPSDYSGVIGGERPPLPDYVDPQIQGLLRKCWHSEPSVRPSFDEIREELISFEAKKREASEALAMEERDDEAKQWPRIFPLSMKKIHKSRMYATVSTHLFRSVSSYFDKHETFE